ncbi:helix-turn-helix transcriptional regulator [Carnobacteriaceae bacterium zg-ZUI78]|nr:helix-turn-helix transcriptional regulator [Carnobacteriaceae bacterium zg-ZUI78]
MKNSSEIVDDINMLYKEQGYSLSELARRIDMPKSSLSRYLNKTREFPLNKIPVFANALNVSEKEILGIESSDDKKQLSKEIQDALDKLLELNKEKQKIVIDFINKQLEEQ